MNRYFTELYKKPDHHKKQFALLASGTVTLMIFGVWSLVTFGVGGGTLAKGSGETNNPKLSVSETSPFQSFRANLASSLEALQQSVNLLKSGVQSVDLNTGYQKMRDGVLNSYGQ